MNSTKVLITFGGDTVAKLTREDVIDIAEMNNLGEVLFLEKRAENTGRIMEVAYVDGTLFAKRQSLNTKFYLCNQFRELAPNDGEGPLG